MGIIKKIKMLKSFVIATLVAFSSAEDFNMQEAEISRQLSVDAYCGHK